jgi:ethanolaminephosphotransferase
MTTGTVPSFIDVALNLGSSKILEDNLLLQARHYDMKLIFYGDDTWLKLFPDIFSRSEGTTSFFVSDFTEVNQLLFGICYIKVKE